MSISYVKYCGTCPYPPELTPVPEGQQLLCNVAKCTSGFYVASLQNLYIAPFWWLLGWSLTPLLSINTVISETKGQGLRVILTQ